MLKNLVWFLAISPVFGVHFAPGTKENDDEKSGSGNDSSTISSKNKNIPIEDFTYGEMVRELTDAELRKIVAEQPLDDPLNAFFDPFEPYRLSTFAYWHPITFPKEHANPPLPAGFLPLNAPPKSFPSDFFFQDDEARRIVLGEHAASFCPYLRRWREKHPLKPYPVDEEFLQVHPPIKFVPGKGYEIDMEQARLNFLTNRAQEQILREVVEDVQAQGAMASAETVLEEDQEMNKSEETNTAKPKKESEKNGKRKKKKPKKKKAIWELRVLLDVIAKVKKARPDCKRNYKFLAPPSENNYQLTSPPSCLEEVIFYMDEMEDIHNPVGIEEGLPEIVNKVEHYRQILIKLDVLNENRKKGKKRKGKCPFGFKKSNNGSDDKARKIYQGNIPKWAELKSGETVYSSSDEEMEKKIISKYRFPYKQVPFPSIQDTLKKYVSI